MRSNSSGVTSAITVEKGTTGSGEGVGSTLPVATVAALTRAALMGSSATSSLSDDADDLTEIRLNAECHIARCASPDPWSLSGWAEEIGPKPSGILKS